MGIRHLFWLLGISLIITIVLYFCKYAWRCQSSIIVDVFVWLRSLSRFLIICRYRGTETHCSKLDFDLPNLWLAMIVFIFIFQRRMRESNYKVLTLLSYMLQGCFHVWQRTKLRAGSGGETRAHETELGRVPGNDTPRNYQ